MNNFNNDKFVQWKKDFPSVNLISDGSTSNDTRIGAVACIHLVVKQANIDDSLMVIAGYGIAVFVVLGMVLYSTVIHCSIKTSV